MITVLYFCVIINKGVFISKPFTLLVLISPYQSLGTHAFKLPIDGTKTSHDRIFGFKHAGMNTPLKSKCYAKFSKN